MYGRRQQGNSLDKLRHTRSVAYSVELVLLNKHQISGGGAYLDYYRQQSQAQCLYDSLSIVTMLTLHVRKYTITSKCA